MTCRRTTSSGGLTLAVEPGPERQEIPRKSVEQFQQVGLSLAPVEVGFQTLLKRLIDRIRVSEYIDFEELSPRKTKKQNSVSSNGRPGTCSPGKGLVAVKEDHPRSCDLVAVLCPVRGNQNCEPNGIPADPPSVPKAPGQS